MCEGHGRQGKDQQDETEPRKPAADTRHSRPFRYHRMPHAADPQQDRPDQPARPEIKRHRNECKNSKARHHLVCARSEREDDVSAIELAAGQKIERGRKHAYPSRNRGGVKINRLQRRRRTSFELRERKNVPDQSKNQRVSQLNVGAGRPRHYLGEWHGKNQRCHRNYETRDWPSDSNVKQCCPRTDWRSNPNESPHGAEERRKRNEEWKRSRDAIVAAAEIV